MENIETPDLIEGIDWNKDEMLEHKLLKRSDTVALYVNAYSVDFTKDITIHEYPFEIKPEVHEESAIRKIFKQISNELFNIYGYFYRSGHSFFSVEECNEDKKFKASIIEQGKNDYEIKIKASAMSTTIKKGKKYDFEEFQEMVLYYIIREILLINPHVHFDRDNLYLDNKRKKLQSDNYIYYLHEGYKLSLQQTDYGMCLIIGVKNKIKGEFTVYDKLYENGKNIRSARQVAETLIGRRFIPELSSRNQQISYIDFDKTPDNTTRNHKGKTYTYYDFYKKILNIEIKDRKQPLIDVGLIDTKYKQKPKYYVPELCSLIGINEEDTQNYEFMKKLSEKTKLEPDVKIEQIDKCLPLFYDTTERKLSPEVINPNLPDKKKFIYAHKNLESNTSNKKREYYGIEVKKFEEPIIPYYVKSPTFSNSEKKELTIKEINSVIPVARENIGTNNWICLYTKKAENQSYDLLKGFLRCAIGYEIKIKDDEENWIPMTSYKVEDWIKEVNNQLYNRPKIKFVIFLLSNREDNLYIPLKRHSLCESGYISQVIKAESIKKAMKNKRGPDSYYSKILLQINNKLGGCNYFLNISDDINKKNIILIGADSSHQWSFDYTSIGLVSTTDDKFSKFYIQNEKIEKETYDQKIKMAINKFIEKTIEKYKKENNNKKPKNIIIFRQGIAHNQIKFMDEEVKAVHKTCEENGIKYYYIFVNTYTSVKFFEKTLMKNNKNKGNHQNPEPGLIVLDQITNKKRFEFYLQPQKVTQGSATPTYFHVAYGNMDDPELLIQLTYWTTFLYPNWQNSVRVPHVIKIAEKLSLMTAKFTQEFLNKELSDKLPIL